MMKYYFEKKNQDFNSYSTSCQTQHKRQPVMLTESEFKKIQEDHPDSFHGYLKYGSSKEKAAYYICPRYWCFNKKTSISHKKLEEDQSKVVKNMVDWTQ